ncbi:MAG: two-component system, OmpR family, sensor histidine kinase CreC [Pseudomonadota bacterium]|nr:two-component system, OmpR family, sensor histidine kinase CreC [Pseudomonadota bacterium]
MNIAIRLFIGYFLIVGLAAWFIVNIFAKEVEPGVRQATEDALVDTANVLAELAAEDLAHGRIASGSFAAAVRAALDRRMQASIYGVVKESVEIRVYLTDHRGLVVYDSEGASVNADFSQWRDVALALRGEYGARSTRENPADPESSVMYVAAPVRHGEKLIGVLSVAKPVTSLMPYADRARERVRRAGFWLLLASLLTGLAFTLWLTRSINRLRNYARTVAEGGKVVAPTVGGGQLSELARALTVMRERLDGKQYVESYVQSLAHEMKSPLTAIRASSELLSEQPLSGEAQRFANHIGEQAERMEQTIERILALARIEQLQAPEALSEVGFGGIVEELAASRTAQADARHIRLMVTGDGDASLHGDRFLLRQAIANLVDNAIAFSPEHGTITIDIEQTAENVCIRVHDQGPGAPDYALTHLFERFYSLPRPSSGRKSTGLGLAFVREVAKIHGGEAGFENNAAGGATASIRLPKKPH